MLKVADLVCGYGDIIAIHKIDMALAKGGTLALTGPNGAGKTTLIMALAGHVTPKSGVIKFAGETITEMAANRRCQRGIALVPEGRRIFPDLTVLENLIVGGYSHPKADQADSLAFVYDVFPRLADRKTQLAGSLSGGEQQMLAFGRAMMARPRLLLVDELSLGLMPKVVDECYVALGKLVDSEIAVILVDQNSDSAIAFCDNFIALESGHVNQHTIA